MTSAEFRFEWDPEKASRNLEKHGIGFEVASAVFLDPLAVSLYDRQHRESEERWITLGSTRSGLLLVVVHTFDETAPGIYRVRIISARKATRRERTSYEDQR